MNKPLETFVVIPNWNGAHYIKECIDSLLAQSVKCNIVIVDNASTDDSDKILAAYKDEITVLKQTKNLGFAGGVNVGIRYALKNKAKYIALFNNDAVADKNWIEELLATINSDDKLGMAASNLMQIDKIHIDSTGDIYCQSGMACPRGRNEVQSGQYDKHTDVFGVCAGASLYRAELFDNVGLFDEKFFAYLEDVDISFRARLMGWKAEYSPKAIAFHHGTGTSSKLGYFARFHASRNFWLVFVKNMPTRLMVKYLPNAIYRYLRMMAASIIRGGFWAYVKGFFCFFKLLPYALRQRKIIQQSKKITARELDKILWHGKPNKFNE